MKRIAWCSPWPPEAGDAADRSAAVVPALTTRGFQIDAVTNDQQAREFAANAAAYSLAVYHLADSHQHEFIWPLVFAHPGLTVLHDGRLHASRSQALLRERRAPDYRTEFAWNHPHVAPAIAELAVSGHDGGFGSQWPMVRAVIAASRLTVTHAAGAMAELKAECPGHPIDYVAASQGAADLAGTAHEQQVRARLRSACGWPESAIVFMACDPADHNSVRPTYSFARIPQILRAFAAVRGRMPDARLVLSGLETDDVDVPGLVRSLGLDGLVKRLNGPGSTDSTDAGLSVDDTLLAADVVLTLRWPAALDMPGHWLRALAAGRATVILDLVHLANIPALDPRTWRRHSPAEPSPDADAAAVTVALDVMDEDHSLRLALQRLAADGPLRARLGHAARAYWEAEHSPSRMVNDYAHAISRALALPRPNVELPVHLRPVMS